MAAGANTFPHAILAGSIGSMSTIIVAQLEDGVRCWVEAEEEYFLLDKESGLTADNVNVIQPLAGAPIAGAADARWLRNFYLEFREIIPLPEGQVAAQTSRGLQTNYDGSSYFLRRDARMDKLLAYVVGGVVGTPSFRFLIYQGQGGGSGIASLLASGSITITGTGEIVVPFDQGAVKLNEGLIYILFGLQNPGGGNAANLQVFTLGTTNLYSANVDTDTHPTQFTTTIPASTAPSSFNPLASGDAVPTASNVTLVARLKNT